MVDSWYDQVRDHPRMCGEHLLLRLDGFGEGSSPHVRGAHLPLQRRLSTHGIIPACAGSTMVVHVLLAAGSGSSPHVRGARVINAKVVD